MYKYIFSVAFLFIGFCVHAQSLGGGPDGSSPKDSIWLDPQMTELLKEVNLVFNENKYATQRSEFVARMPLRNIDNPQAYNVVTHSLMESQLVTGYEDIFKNVSGTGVPSRSSNGRLSISSRGFKVKSYIVDGMASYNKLNIDPANIDKVEVIHGPSATLYGNTLTSYGGLVNIITKKPYKDFGAEIGYRVGSFNTHRLEADVNTPLTKDERLRFRINLAGHKEDSQQDGRFMDNLLIAPSITYVFKNDMSLNVSSDFFVNKSTSPYHLIPYKNGSITDVRDLGIDRNLSFNADNAYFTGEQSNTRLTFKAPLNAHWSATTAASFSRTDERGYRVGLVATSDSTLVRDVRTGPKNYNVLNIRQDFLNDISFGNNLRNRFLVGVDYLNYWDHEIKLDNKSMSEVNFVNPGEDYFDFNRAYLDEYFHGKEPSGNTKIKESTYGAYVSDVFSIEDRWHISAALRLDHFDKKGQRDLIKNKIKDDFSQTTLSPKVGLVYQPIIDRLSLYTNYQNGFTNVNGSDVNGKSFRPEQADQYEAGVKLMLFGGKLIGRATFYDIQVKNIVREDLLHTDEKVQDGTQMSRGVEFELITNPVKGLDILGGYAYNHSKYLKTDSDIAGRRPDGAGPEHTANLWVNYTFPDKLKGLQIGAGGNYGTHLITVKKYEFRDFYVPSYLTVDASISYSHSFYTVQLKMNNLTNETYWNNRLMVQPERSIMAGLKVYLDRI